MLEINVQLLYPDWVADYSDTSLFKLYEWFKQQIAYRVMTQEEKEQIENQISITPLFVGVIPIPELTFTVETVTICFDTSIYFGETLVYNTNNLKWKADLASKKYADYAQPLLFKDGNKVPLNPRRIIENVAYNILDKGERDMSFIKLFDTWKRAFE